MNEPMTSKEFQRAMENIYSEDREKGGAFTDSVTAHIEADSLMTSLLRTLGYGEGIDIFERADKWYT